MLINSARIQFHKYIFVSNHYETKSLKEFLLFIYLKRRIIMLCSEKIQTQSKYRNFINLFRRSAYFIKISNENFTGRSELKWEICEICKCKWVSKFQSYMHSNAKMICMCDKAIRNQLNYSWLYESINGHK